MKYSLQGWMDSKSGIFHAIFHFVVLNVHMNWFDNLKSAKYTHMKIATFTVSRFAYIIPVVKLMYGYSHRF